jgi:hypothetical protein
MFTREPTPSELLDLSEGAKLASLQQPLSEDLAKLREQVYAKVFTAISKGELTADAAIQAWHEVHAYHRIQQRINQRVKVGQSVSANLHKGE